MADLNSLPLPALFSHLVGDPLSPQSPVRRLLALAMDEDLSTPPRDITSLAALDSAARTTARMVAREGLTVAGLACLPALVTVFAQDQVRLAVPASDGATVPPGTLLAEFSGPISDILAIERTALNLVSRLCGVASLAARFVAEIHSVGRARIFDTRKTTPGMRALEKYAVRCGGAMAHRLGLFDAVLLKDNHLAGVSLDALPSFVAQAAHRARAAALQAGQPLSFVELEVDTLEQLRRVLAAGGCGLDIILLDNMSLDHLRQAVLMRDQSGLSIELEASGGVRLDTVRDIARTGVERISAGAITHHAVSRDIGLDIE